MQKKTTQQWKTLQDIKSLLMVWGFSLKGLKSNKNGEWLLISQIIIILFHLIPPWPNINFEFTLFKYLPIIGLYFFTQGIILLIRAFRDLGRNLSPLPEPMKNAELITFNCYKTTRHPLYKSLILTSLGITIMLSSLSHFLLLIILSILLKRKALWEENKLIQVHPDYKEYLQNVPAIMKGFYFLDWRD